MRIEFSPLKTPWELCQKPIRKGVVSHTLMVEELGRRKVNCGEFYVLRFYNRLDETKKGEIACAAAGEAQKWMEAFDQAKQQAVYDLSIATGRHKLNTDTELNLDGHRPRVRRYAHGLKKLIRIGKGPEMLLRKTSDLESYMRTNTYLEVDTADAIEAHDWRCVRTDNGPVSATLYLGYSLFMVLAIMLATGTVGFLSSFWFVHYLFSSVKLD